MDDGEVVPQPAVPKRSTISLSALAFCLGCVPVRAQPGGLGFLAETASLWEQHQTPIIAAMALIALQFVLITTLLIQYFRLRRAEGFIRTSEARWRSVVDNPIFGVTFIDRDHRFIDTNPTYRRMVGYSNDELRRISPLDISVPGEREVNELLLNELREGKRQHFEMIKQLRRKDGSLIWIQLYVFRIPDPATKSQLMFGMMQDITESKRSQDALQATRAELARVARINRFGAMTASIAHEINQPLAAIVANANAGQRWLSHPEPDLDEVRAALKRIAEDGHRTAELVQGIRAMFKNDAQKRVPLDVNELIREVLALVHKELMEHRIAVFSFLSADLPQVIADRVQLQQVIMNLVANAIDAMESVTDRPQTLRVKSEMKNDERIMVSIEDSGVGIDPDKMDRLFDSFFTTKPDGMGMGLSICKSIIEAHDGRLWAALAAQHGSIFRFELPIEPAAQEQRLPGV
ncbi:MAG: PAS domain S-box protein [Xanthobacteraceae bacterium]|nr:PAS domain S-box protein [Xanthobacteraceae bacterium]